MNFLYLNTTCIEISTKGCPRPDGPSCSELILSYLSYFLSPLVCLNAPAIIIRIHRIHPECQTLNRSRFLSLSCSRRSPQDAPSPPPEAAPGTPPPPPTAEPAPPHRVLDVTPVVVREADGQRFALCFGDP